MRVVVGVERPDVAPVAVVARGRAGNVVAREVVDAHLARIDEHRHDVSADVVLRAHIACVSRHRFDQRLGAEDVVAHRREHLVRRVGKADGISGLLAKRRDLRSVRTGLDHAELGGLLDRHADSRNRCTGARLDVLRKHLARVHPVDVIGAEDDHVVGLVVVDEIQALVDRVGGAREPVRAAAHLRGHRRDVVAEQVRHAPRQGDVPVERVTLVLREHDDAQVAGVDEVREREVDQPVAATERDGRLRPVGGQRHQALALAAGEHDREYTRRRHA